MSEGRTSPGSNSRSYDLHPLPSRADETDPDGRIPVSRTSSDIQATQCRQSPSEPRPSGAMAGPAPYDDIPRPDAAHAETGIPPSYSLNSRSASPSCIDMIESSTPSIPPRSPPPPRQRPPLPPRKAPPPPPRQPPAPPRKAPPPPPRQPPSGPPRQPPPLPPRPPPSPRQPPPVPPRLPASPRQPPPVPPRLPASPRQPPAVPPRRRPPPSLPPPPSTINAARENEDGRIQVSRTTTGIPNSPRGQSPSPPSDKTHLGASRSSLMVEPLAYTQDPSSSSIPLHMPAQAAPSATTPRTDTVQAASHTQSFFKDAHHFTMGNLTIHTVSEQWRFSELPKHPDMSGVQAEYLPDSRKPDVEESLQWISSLDDLVLCIHGPAGVGKSTLVRHLSKELRSVGRLGASVFLGAFPPDTSGPETIIKTLAHELGNIHPRAIPKIVEAMNQCHGTSLENQLEGYILKPLQSFDYPYPFVVIVDGIDEWRDHPPFIKALARLNPQSAVIKLILTCRWDLLTSRLRGIETTSMRSYPLRPVPSEVAKAYFTHHLESVDWESGRKPGSREVDRLAELSDGLLVWGATVCSLLSHKFNYFRPHEILSAILAEEHKVGSEEQLAQLYSNAIVRLFPIVGDRTYLRDYLGATFVLQETLPVDDFCRLVGMPLHLVVRIQATLSAVQTRSPPAGSEKMVHPASTLFHKSFLDYVQATPAENTFTISAFDSHSALGLACLNQIPSLPPLPPTQTSSSSLRGLQRYVVKFWPLHVSHGTHRSHDEWVKTPHCSVLNSICLDAQRRWATQFLNILVPEAGRVVMEEQDDMAAILTRIGDRLRRDGGEHWVFEVACLEVAVRVDHGWHWAWRNLGGCYDNMGRRNGSSKMYEEAVLARRCALELLAASDPERSRMLSDLGNSLWSLYGCNGDVDVLNEGISHLHDALALLPAPHPDRVTSLIRLGGALRALFERTGDLNALNEGIKHLRDVVALLPKSHPERPASLNNLGNALYSLFHRNGDIKALNEGIFHDRDALALRPAPHPDRSFSLTNLGISLRALFNHGGDVNALNEAILHLRAATALQPVPHPNRPSSLISLGNALRKLYGCNRNLDALKESILHLRAALALLPGAHPSRPFALRDLGNALHTLYESNGDLDALHEGISHQRDALTLWPVSHQERPVSLDYLAIALLSHHKRHGDIETLDEAIKLRREVLASCPPGHRYRPYCAQSLAEILEIRFTLTDDEADRDEFEALQEELDEYESGNGSERDDESGTEGGPWTEEADSNSDDSE